MILVSLSVVVLAGFGYERIARAGDAERYPPPGELIEVDDHRLHLLCLGAGSPTMVLEAGLGESALGWASVQRELAAGARVCSYDRAGLAWTEPAAGSPTAERSAAHLHALLEAAGEAGPYVLVGHSDRGNDRARLRGRVTGRDYGPGAGRPDQRGGGHHGG